MQPPHASKERLCLYPAEIWLAQRLGLGATQSVDRPCLKRQLFGMVNRMLSDTGQNAPPFDPKPIARKFAKVQDIRVEALNCDGMLIPVNDGFIIKINRHQSRRRRRAVCAHELGHTFFYDLDRRPPQRGYLDTASPHWVEEGYCYEIAREMLMPESHVRTIITSRDSSKSILWFLKHLVQKFDCSPELVVKRIQDLDLWDAIIVIFQANDSDEGPYFVVKKYHSNPFKCGAFHSVRTIKMGTAIDETSILHNILLDTYVADKETVHREKVRLGQMEQVFLVESMPLKRSSSILSVFSANQQ